MKTIHLTAYGNPAQNLKLVAVSEPKALSASEALVRMEYAPIVYSEPKLPSVTGGEGAGIVDGIGGEVLSEALGVLALGGSLTTLGYSASRKTTIDVTNLIVPQASIRGLNMFAQPKATITDAWKVIVSLLKAGAIKP